MTSTYTEFGSPIGRLLILANNDGLAAIHFAPTSGAHAIAEHWTQGGSMVDDAARQLGEYFAGTRRSFDLPLAPKGTPFMTSVWNELVRIPYGATTSYGELARRLGKPKAARAIGSANGKNPIPIVVPCHRVIGANGTLTGFAGGLDVKRQLLELEGCQRIGA